MIDGAFDVIVIGGGPAGEVLAGRTADAGLKTALVESELVGGECSFWACIPSKTLLRPGTVLDAARRVPAAASAVTGLVDAAAALRTRDEAVKFYDDQSQVDWVAGKGVTLLRGTGQLSGERRVVVRNADGEKSYDAARAVVLATGSRPTMPPIDGLAEVKPWDSRGATGAKVVPRRLAVVGGGVVAVEMAQAFHWLGSKVTLLVRGARLLEREEPFAGEELVSSFIETGIDVRLSTGTKSARRVPDGSVELALSDGNVVVADEVLVATGRKPATNDIGLETVGLTPGKPVAVDDQLRAVDVDGEWLYAIGDVNGRALFTHMGKYQARLAADVIAGKSVEAWSDRNAIPSVIFTSPQIASVGRRLADAQNDEMNVREVRVRLESTAGAYVNGNEQGTAQIVVDEDRRVIVGATFTGPEAGELLHAATIAVTGQVPLDRLWHAVPAYPTVSEIWLQLLEAYGL